MKVIVPRLLGKDEFHLGQIPLFTTARSEAFNGRQ
jgi:hypothetical protein